MADTEHFVDEISGHVRGLLKDAEELATQIITQAEAAAVAERKQAEAEASRIRHQAEAEAASIREPAEEMAKRAESRAKRILAEFRQSLEQLEATLGWDQVAEAPDPPTPAPEAHGPVTERPADQGSPAVVAEEPRYAPQTPAPPEPQAAEPTARGELADDAEAARLVAMKLALEGSTPEEIKAQLAAEYRIEDLDSLIDQVYTQSAHLSRIKKWMPSLKRPQ